MTRINIFDEQLQQLIRDRGVDLIWEKAVVCNCYNPNSSQPDFLCPFCHGSGFRYINPTSIRAAVTSLTSNYTLDSLMLREPGTAYLTPQAEIIMGYHDRLTFTEFKCAFSEIIRLESDSTYSPTFRNILQVLFLAYDNYELTLNTDYTISDDHYHIIPLIPTPPESLSILYLTEPRYYVIDLLHELRAHMTDRYIAQESFRELPKQYLIKRELWDYGININKEN